MAKEPERQALGVLFSAAPMRPVIKRGPGVSLGFVLFFVIGWGATSFAIGFAVGALSMAR